MFALRSCINRSTVRFQVGECNYYLKARFSSIERAEAAVPILCELLGQGERARAYWQESRPRIPRTSGSEPPSPEAFWAGFRQRFPLVYSYLRELADTPDWNNGLAGQLSCLVDPKIPRHGDPGASLDREDRVLLLKLGGIWHCAELGRLERFFLEDLGAVAVGSVSEEDFDLDEEEGEVMTDGEFFDAIDA
jgi:hypothetical protein